MIRRQRPRWTKARSVRTDRGLRARPAARLLQKGGGSAQAILSIDRGRSQRRTSQPGRYNHEHTDSILSPRGKYGTKARRLLYRYCRTNRLGTRVLILVITSYSLVPAHSAKSSTVIPSPKMATASPTSAKSSPRVT